MQINIDSLYNLSCTDNASIIDMINVFKEKIMLIYSSILLGKKILFIGYERPI